MHTIFWGSMIGVCGTALIIAFYFYLSHEDLRKGVIGTMDLTNCIRKFYPFEAVLQIISFLCFLVYQDYFVLALALPMCIYNVKMLMKKEFNIHGISPEEYSQKQYFEKISYYKTLIHTTILLYVIYKFVFSFSKAVTYQIDRLMTWWLKLFRLGVVYNIIYQPRWFMKTRILKK